MNEVLNHKMEIYVPKRVYDKQLQKVRQLNISEKKIVKNLREHLVCKYGSLSVIDINGYYERCTGVVEVPCSIYYVYTREVGYKTEQDHLRYLAKCLRKQLKQDSIALVFDNVMEIID